LCSNTEEFIALVSQKAEECKDILLLSQEEKTAFKNVFQKFIIKILGKFQHYIPLQEKIWSTFDFLELTDSPNLSLRQK